MLSISIWIAFISYAVATAYTPGPNNILSLNTTTTYGFRKSNPLRMGIGVGFTLLIFFTSIITFFFGAYAPMVVTYLKYIGALYIFYLSYKVMTAKPIESSDTKIPAFWTGFVLQFMNVKVILYGFTAVSTFFLPNYSRLQDLLWFYLILVVNSLIAIWVWGILGYALKNFINKYYKIFNIVMALVLLESAISILLQ
ncbi:MAG: LysE family transporter [Candidatus Izemoplasmatales bacterium]